MFNRYIYIDPEAPLIERTLKPSGDVQRLTLLGCVFLLYFWFQTIDPHENFKAAIVYWINRPLLSFFVFKAIITNFSGLRRLELDQEGFSYLRGWRLRQFRWEDVTEFRINPSSQRLQGWHVRFFLWFDITLRGDHIEFCQKGGSYSPFKISNTYNNQGETLHNLLNKYRNARLASLGLTEKDFKSALYLPNPIPALDAITIVIVILLPAFVLFFSMLYDFYYK